MSCAKFENTFFKRPCSLIANADAFFKCMTCNARVFFYNANRLNDLMVRQARTVEWRTGYN